MRGLIKGLGWLIWSQRMANTVWFFSTAIKDQDIMQKLDKLAKFWKKPLDESLQFFAGRFQGFSVKKMIILILVPLLMRFCKIWNVGKFLKYWLNCFSLNCSHFWTTELMFKDNVEALIRKAFFCNLALLKDIVGNIVYFNLFSFTWQLNQVTK